MRNVEFGHVRYSAVAPVASEKPRVRPAVVFSLFLCPTGQSLGDMAPRTAGSSAGRALAGRPAGRPFRRNAGGFAAGGGLRLRRRRLRVGPAPDKKKSATGRSRHGRGITAGIRSPPFRSERGHPGFAQGGGAGDQQPALQRTRTGHARVCSCRPRCRPTAAPTSGHGARRLPDFPFVEVAADRAIIGGHSRPAASWRQPFRRTAPLSRRGISVVGRGRDDALLVCPPPISPPVLPSSAPEKKAYAGQEQHPRIPGRVVRSRSN